MTVHTPPEMFFKNSSTICRRAFLAQTALAGASMALSQTIAPSNPQAPLNRIAISSSTLRSRFPQTSNKQLDKEDELQLIDLPKLFAERFRVRQIELWSLHFPSRSRSYLDQLKRAAAQHHSQYINIQVDGPYQLGSESETERKTHVKMIQEWIKTAAYLGVPSIRANPGKGALNQIIRSFRELRDFANDHGILLLTENHLGIETDPAVHLEIHRAVGSKNFKIIADFGNYPDTPERYDALTQIMPLTHLVSAKVMDLDHKFEHTTFDYQRCLRIATDSGFRGSFSIEQWSPKPVPHPPEAVIDWAIRQIQSHLTA